MCVYSELTEKLNNKMPNNIYDYPMLCKVIYEEPGYKGCL